MLLPKKIFLIIFYLLSLSTVSLFASHNAIYSVIADMPENQRRFWNIPKMLKGQKKMVALGSPDVYAGASEEKRNKIKNYFVFRDYNSPIYKEKDKLMHYLPATSDLVEGQGEWQANSIIKARYVMNGLRNYLDLIGSYIQKKKNNDAAITAFALCHFIQDQTAFFHSLEGEEGMSPWDLEKIMNLGNDPNLHPVSLLGERVPKSFSMSNYNPTLLGTSKEEIVFNLYQRYRKLKKTNRLLVMPLIYAQCRKDISEENKIRNKIIKGTMDLCADVFYSLYVLYAKLTVVPVTAPIAISEIVPVNSPKHFSNPYRFKGLTPNYALSVQQKKVPLTMLITNQNGELKIKRFSRGLGLGNHRKYRVEYLLPLRVYKKFDGWFGLLGSKPQGNAVVKVFFNKKQLTSSTINSKNPSVRLDVDIWTGGLLTIQVESLIKWNDSKNNFVLTGIFKK
jgi:NPCBM/NEW2 domain